MVCKLSLTVIPPRGPTSNEAALANSSLGLIPAEITSISTSKELSSEKLILDIASLPLIAVVFFDV
jgi:hypothetical protein